MKVFFNIAAVICIVAAGVLWLRQHHDAAFVAGTMGAVSAFLGYRVKMKRILAENETRENDQGDELNENSDT